MKRKPLEGIESLLFVLGAGLGSFLIYQGYNWWIVSIIVVVSGWGIGKLVEFLREKSWEMS